MTHSGVDILPAFSSRYARFSTSHDERLPSVSELVASIGRSAPRSAHLPSYAAFASPAAPYPPAAAFAVAPGHARTYAPHFVEPCPCCQGRIHQFSVHTVPLYQKAYARQKRQRSSQAQLRVLEEQFLVNPMPSHLTRVELALRLNMTPRRIQVWFQNKRAKIRRSIRNGEEVGVQLPHSSESDESEPDTDSPPSLVKDEATSSSSS